MPDRSRVNFGFAKKVRIKIVLPLATVLASVKRGTVSGDVSHFACQSESDVTTSQPPNPATAFLDSVPGTKFPVFVPPKAIFRQGPQLQL